MIAIINLNSDSNEHFNTTDHQYIRDKIDSNKRIYDDFLQQYTESGADLRIYSFMEVAGSVVAQFEENQLELINSFNSVHNVRKVSQ